MTSIFFQTPNGDFLYSQKISNYGGERFRTRMISFRDGTPKTIYLSDVTLNELSILAAVLRSNVVPNVRSLRDLVSVIGYRIIY